VRAGLLAAILCGLFAAASASADVVDIRSRGETTRMLVEPPDGPSGAPAGVAVLFAGGGGVLKITEDGVVRKLKGNFLVRSAGLFRDHGFVTADIDGPSDRPYDLFGFRGTEDHAQDIGAAIAYLRATYKAPVWLVGTSRGSMSAANGAVRLQGAAGPDGIALTSSVLVDNAKGDHVLMYDLDAVRVPVVIAHHRSDGCKVTPPEALASLEGALKHAKAVKTLWFEGGVDRGNPCQARGHHGFAGIEGAVVAALAQAMKDFSR
jgi:hypothetical protein